MRDSIRRDVEQAVAALAFAERLHHKMDTQRRVFLDFPRAMEQLRSGAIERVTVALSRLYEGGQGFDLQRFIRDLPLALAHLAAADRTKSAPPPAAEGSTPPPADASPTPAASTEPSTSTSTESSTAPSTSTSTEASTTPSTSTSTEPSTPPSTTTEVSPRLELRSKLLAAAPQLAKAAQSYRRNVATLKRASLPRRSPGPWRADREVLEEAHRAVEFVQKLYDAYAEAWADQPLQPNLYEQTAAEVDRFLAWTQLDRYVELAVLASTNVPRPPKPGQHLVSGPLHPPTEAAAGGATAAEEKPAEPKPPEEKPAEDKPAEPAAAASQPVPEPGPA
ncbi:MAG: hypothetical protein ACXWLM_06115 [Myxococcales bacterium]